MTVGKPARHDDRGAPLGRLGRLVTRLADNADEVAAAQEVRFRAFRREGAARPADASPLRDADRFDAVCDHLLVIDTAIAASGAERIVGTYRLLRQENAAAAGGFYSESEFELAALVARHPGRRFLELGRSCVLPQYRNRRTIELLWQGIWAYCRRHGIDVMTGCASFAGTAPAAHAMALSFLGHFRQAEDPWHVRAVAARHHTLDMVPVEAVDTRAALAAMPPLVKGYLRLGARFGQGCVVDPEFATTDVLVVLPVESICERYINHYGAGAERFAA